MEALLVHVQVEKQAQHEKVATAVAETVKAVSESKNLKTPPHHQLYDYYYYYLAPHQPVMEQSPSPSPSPLPSPSQMMQVQLLMHVHCEELPHHELHENTLVTMSPVFSTRLE